MSKLYPLFLIVSALMIEACAHVHLQSWDGKRVEVCGNKRAKEEDFEALGNQWCHGKNPRLIAGGIKKNGDSQISAYTTGPFASASVSGVKEQCRVFVCE